MERTSRTAIGEESRGEVLAKKPDDPFWSDILFEAKNAAWAYERTCQLGIKAFQMRDRCLEKFRDVFDPFTRDIARGPGIDASSSSMVLNHTFPQHASSFVRHFSAQSSSSKRRRSSAQASQTQTDASAKSCLQHTAISSKRSKKTPWTGGVKAISRVTRRSVKSIGNKYLSVKRGWQTVHNLTHQTGAGDGEGSSQFMLQQATWISPKLISVVIKNAIVPITTSGTRYSKVDMAQDLSLGPVLLARTILL
ncbi:hypothetical protein IAS59_000796 [Cryptococcus gattii]